MNPETARALAGETTRNIAPYLDGTRPIRRPDATGELPVRLRPAAPAIGPGLATDARAGQGRHRQDSRPPLALILAVESVVVVVLAAWVIWLVMTR